MMSSLALDILQYVPWAREHISSSYAFRECGTNATFSIFFSTCSRRVQSTVVDHLFCRGLFHLPHRDLPGMLLI